MPLPVGGGLCSLVAAAAGLLALVATATADSSCGGEPWGPGAPGVRGEKTECNTLLQTRTSRMLQLPGGGRDDPPPPPPRRSTAIVLQAYREFSEWQRSLLARYASQVRGTGIQVAMLRDVSGLRHEGDQPLRGTSVAEPLHVATPGVEALGHPTVADVPPGTASVQRSVLRLGMGAPDDPAIPICEVTWTAVRDEFSGSLGGYLAKASAHYFHGPYQVLWWRYCAKDLLFPEHVWLVEPDAYFTGDAARFVGAYADEDADLIASGFRLVGQHWWAWWYVGRSGLDRSLLRALTKTTRVVKNLQALPDSHQGRCKSTDPEVDSEGILFRQDHVERVSSKLLESLSRSLDAGLLLPSEVWEPTLCAHQLHGARNCTMLDFAPLLGPDGGDPDDRASWISRRYCWDHHYDFESCEHCEACQTAAAWADRWVHPVKTLVWGAMDCANCCENP